MRLTKPQWGFAFYDFANSAFATTVMAGFFPLFFKSYWGSELTATQSTFYLGLSNSLVGIAVLLTVIPLGRLADRQGQRKKMLMGITLVSSFLTAMLAIFPEGSWLLPMILFILCSLGFSLANAVYDSLILGVAKESELDWISGVGYALGYLGGGLLFLVNVLMALNPSWFGLSHPTEAVKISFLLVGAWWILFSLPLWKWTPEPEGLPKTLALSGREIWSALKSRPKVFYFLIAYVFYIDAVNTIIKMAVDYGSALGFRQNDLITALLLVQFVAFPAALLLSWIGEKIGAIKGVYLCIGVYLLITFLAVNMTSSRDFYLLATLIGLVQGGIQSLSRSHFAKFVPKEHTSTFFAIYNLFGKFSTVLGPGLMGLVALATGSSRASLVVVVGFFLIGLGFLKVSQTQKT